jgi:hypothetical protein
MCLYVYPPIVARQRYCKNSLLNARQRLGKNVKATSQSQSHITTDDQSVSASWFRALSGAHDHMFITV